MIRNTALVLDTLKAKQNIKKMASKARLNNLEFRPHFKTHQSHKVGELFKAEGINGITVSSLKMARYFSQAGWDSITIAFPVNILEIDQIDTLASNIDLRLLATDLGVLDKLNSAMSNQVGIYIELDPNYNRSGIPILEFKQLKILKEYILNATNLRFEGFYTHAGHSYKCRSKEEIIALIHPILEDLTKLKSEFGDPICFGDTPSCSVLNNFGIIDQISAGNFVFYDWTQFKISSCSVSEIAVAMYCPVLAKYPDRNELIIHGGAVHFSKDSFTEPSGNTYFGIVAEKKQNRWGNPVPETFLKSISQEHGIVKCSQTYFEETNVGDLVPIIPIHSCLTADLMSEYISLDGHHLDHMNKKIF